MKTCKTCYYDIKKDKGCKIYKEKQENCDSWADMKEAKKREEAIERYKPYFPVSKYNPVRALLDKHFMNLYEQGYNDTEIAKKLDVSQSSVNGYRKRLELESQKVRKAKEKKRLREQANNE